MNIDLEVLIALSNKKDLQIEKGFTIFLNHISEFKRIETLNYYKTYYNSFIPFFQKENINTCSQLNNETLLLMIVYFKHKGNKNSTINKKIACIKYMLNYLDKMGLINKPKLNIEKLPNDETRFKTISRNDVMKIIEYSNQVKPKIKLQLLLLLFTGIRRNELVHILISNIQPDFITLDYTKTKKSRNIYITNEIYELIKEVKKGNKVYLFENEQHTSYENPDNINCIFKQLYEKTGIKTSPHCLRHTYATTLLENGADLESIRLLLGHSDYSMLSRYIHIKNKKLAELSTSLYYEKEQPTDIKNR